MHHVQSLLGIFGHDEICYLLVHHRLFEINLLFIIHRKFVKFILFLLCFIFRDSELFFFSRKQLDFSDFMQDVLVLCGVCSCLLEPWLEAIDQVLLIFVHKSQLPTVEVLGVYLSGVKECIIRS